MPVIFLQVLYLLGFIQLFFFLSWRFSFFFKILKRQNFFILFVSIFCLTSPSLGGDPPSLLLDESLPQSLLPSDDLIFSQPPSAPHDPDSAATVLEGFESTRNAHSYTVEQRKEAEIMRLLKELKYSVDIDEAKNISQQIQLLWSQSGNETIDLLMAWADDSISAEDYGLTLDYLDTAIALSPTYATAWVKRAWVHIQLSDFKLAMLDLERAITLEPRNYMAFFELGITMEATERPQLAIKAYETALYYYPQMQQLQERIGILLEKQSSQEV
ncbi:tetratricopeptide repeat protein [Bartonella sp. A05]|uniref:tetratricopeptide repeat protein n=1 Tax=Bartonella sp. A05 TaxID=2967261 RepID=UPI0022A96833|nr:hypothetical protein [Bartonella sp. A05]MCZ2203707.1 hypothetical protein [Bartonella sp. A05]